MQNVPQRHFPKWLRVMELRIWLGFVQYVLTLGAITAFATYLCNKPPEALKDSIKIAGAIGSLAGIIFGIHRYIKQNRRDDD